MFMKDRSGARLKTLLEMRGIKPADFCAQIEVSPQKLNNWFKRGISKEGLFKVAKALEISVEELNSGKQQLVTINEDQTSYLLTAPPNGLISMYDLMSWKERDELPAHLFSWIHVYNIELAAGSGRLVAHEYSKKSLPFMTDWLRKIGVQPDQAALVYVTGDSMEPGIKEGAIVLIDRRRKDIRNGIVYAIRLGDEVLIKRLFKEVGGVVVVRSDNPVYNAEQRLQPERIADLEIIGQVLWQAAMVR